MKKIGFLSPFWLPLWGGAEQYHYRIAEWLIADGFDVQVLCATFSSSDRNNGEILVNRYTDSGQFRTNNTARDPQKRRLEEISTRSQHYQFIDEAVHFCVAKDIELVLMGSPLQVAHNAHFRELYRRLRDRNIAIGIFFHDLPNSIEATLRQFYEKDGLGWENAAKNTEKGLKNLVNSLPRSEWSAIISSPIFFDPDFIICNSEWTARFIDPNNEVQKIIVHPPLTTGSAFASDLKSNDVAETDLLMVNPQPRKGNLVMRSLIEDLGASKSYRVLKGGWGDAFALFSPMIAALPARVRHRVELIEYAEDMGLAYRKAGVLVFPSLYEGYGMTPIEAMAQGTPVVSSDYPAILEAVGEGALTLCPTGNTRHDWAQAVREVLDNREVWSIRAKHRVEAVRSREVLERIQFKRFLQSM